MVVKSCDSFESVCCLAYEKYVNVTFLLLLNAWPRHVYHRVCVVFLMKLRWPMYKSLNDCKILWLIR